MFSIQYQAINGEHKMQTFDGTRSRLIVHLAQFPWPIIAVYEQATPITKTVRKELEAWPGSLSRYAHEFITSRS